MKKFLIFWFLALGILAFSGTYEEYYNAYMKANSNRDINEMKTLLNDISQEININSDILTVKALVFTELANWGTEIKEEKEEYYAQAIANALAALEDDKNNYLANFAAGAAYGRLAQFKGIVSSLFMLGDFDKYIGKCLEINEKYYPALVAMGMRYRDVPWPLKNNSKAEKYLLKAIETEPGYVNGYYELGVLYQQMKDTKKSKEYFQKTIDTELHKDWIEQGKQAKIDAREELKKFK